MGGVVSVALLPLSELDSCLKTRGCINVVIKTGKDWHDCHSMHMKTRPDDQIQINDGGTIVDSTITIDSLATEEEALFFRDSLTAGCLIKAKLSNGDVIVYGDDVYPMIGSIVRVVGEQESDANIFRVTASNGTLDGPLLLL